MRLRLCGDRKIDNLRAYQPEIVAELRALLATGAQATPDPRRPGFFDVYSGDRVFFIHVSPVSGTVMLLASWRTGSMTEIEKPGAYKVFAA
jgi:hypothetical protein